MTGAQRRTGRDPWFRVVVSFVAAPFVAAAVAALARSGLVTGDLALIEMAVRDTGTSHTPLVGPFSRFGWNHPGPAMFWLLAPFYRLLGTDAQALYSASALVAGLGAGLLCWVSHRLGGRRLLLAVGFGTAVLVHAAGTSIVDPWNPYLTVIPFAVFLVAAAAVATGDLRVLPVAVGAGSFVVQSHVSFVVPVAAVSSCAAIVLWFGLRESRATETTTTRIAAVLPGLAVLLGFWAGPIVDQVRNTPGNLAQIAGFFLGFDVEGNRSTDEPAGGLTLALGSLGRQLHPLGPWLGGPEVTADGATLQTASAWWSVPVVAMLAVAVWMSRKSRDRNLAVLGGTVSAGLFGAFVATALLKGEPYWYLLRFWWPLAMLTWATVACAATRRLPRMSFGGRGRAASLVVAWLVAGLVALAVVVPVAGEPEPTMGRAGVDSMANDVVAGLVPGGVYLVESSGWSLYHEMFGVVNLLDARGFTALTAPMFANHVGGHRVFDDDGDPGSLDGRIIVASNRAVEELAVSADLRLLASFDPLDSAERAETSRLRTALIESLEAAGLTELADAVGALPAHLLLGAKDVSSGDIGFPAVDAARLRELETRGSPLAVYLARP